MDYCKLFGQESGIWIYKQNGAALIVNWSGAETAEREPVDFYGALVWLPSSSSNGGAWVKTADGVRLDGYIFDNVNELVYDANNDAPFCVDMTGDVWETDNYIVLVPYGWN